MLTLRRQPSFTDEQIQRLDNKYIKFFKKILPSFVFKMFRGFFSVIGTIINKVKIQRGTILLKPGQISKQFNRRRFEQHLQLLKITQQQLGFTNQVLYQQSKKAINYYLPVFITNKIKNIQDVQIQNMVGNISCAMIINVGFQGVPQEIVKRLQSSIIVQLNRGEAIKLQDDGISITVKRDKKANFLVFTLRKIFLASLIQDTLWSPFELVELIISITLNTVSIPPFALQKNEGSTYKPQKQYKISFNCMRNSDTIPISFALDCVFGIYDLAERKLETYHSKVATYGQIIRNYDEYLARQTNRINLEKALKKGENKVPAETNKRLTQSQKRIPFKKSAQEPSIVQIIAQSTMKRLSIRASNHVQKIAPPKVKYFQYSHFIIPLYKYPGNSLATIFIPILLLALVSLAIFFQQPELSGRIGAIATMILGYIALIPSIKEQLPPSSKITVVQIVVYIETMCCLLCLYQSFLVDGQDESNIYKFIWSQSFTFMLCLFVHISTFIFVIGIFVVHKFKWEPSYNYDQKVIQIKPAQCRHSWDNPFCDQVFITFNKSIQTDKYSEKQKEELLIRPLKPKKQVQQKKGKNEQNINQQVSFFDKLISLGNANKKQHEKTTQVKTIEKLDEKEFSMPDPILFYKSQNKIKQV